MGSTENYWSMTEGVFTCLYDSKRTLSFKRAIKRTVRQGDIVVDAGSGTGVLAMFAADAGAKKVYAIESDENNAKVLKSSFTANGYGDRIEVIQGDAMTLDLPEKVDVIACEMIAIGLIEELQVPVINNMLRQVNSDYRVVLEQYHCHAELVHQKNSYYGKQFNIMRYEFPDKPSLKSNVLSNRITYKSVDFSQSVLEDHIAERLEFVVQEAGIINGLRISATTNFHGGGSSCTQFPIAIQLSCR